MALDLAAVWTYFADTSCGEYSPLYDRICRTVAASDEVLALIAEAPPRGHLPNVLLGAVHYLLLGGLDDPLAEVYAGRSDADVGPLFVDFCLRHRDELLDLLATRHTNTNEVGRSALLGPALTVVATRVGAPLGLVDVGCSAGVNLLCDHYLLDYGPGGTTGRPMPRYASRARSRVATRRSRRRCRRSMRASGSTATRSTPTTRTRPAGCLRASGRTPAGCPARGARSRSCAPRRPDSCAATRSRP